MMRTAADGEAYDRTAVERVDPLVGSVLDRRFRIDFQLAAGGFGAIYRATDVLSDAEVALKVLLPKLARDPMVVARFRREGKMLANLRDPHTVTAYELGEAPDGTLYIVMELLRGESLYERFRSGGALPWRRVLHIARGVCSSLAEAHALGVVHRDLKPANIHLESRDGDPDFVKVLDFGIAKIVQGNGREHTQLTQAGQMIGTVDYMSPEQMVGGELTPASDIYTLGVVIYEMIAGKTPFADAQTATAILAAVLTQTPEPLSSHVPVPAMLDQVVARCLEREAENRFRDIGDLADALARITAGPARPSPVAPSTVVPSTGFERVILTDEATRIDVRPTESSEPVLDARGPRRRLPEGLGAAQDPHSPTVPHRPVTPPAGAAAPAQVRGSRSALEGGRTPQPRGSTPVVEPPARPSRGAGGSAMPTGTPTPIAAPPGYAAPPAAPVVYPLASPVSPPLPYAGPRPMHTPPPPLQAAPPIRPPAYEVPSYDMAAATSYDKMVRRILWIAVLIAVVAGVVIAKW